MSGLEPLVALGLTCNILQIVDVGRQTVGLIRKVYQGGIPDDTLNENAASLGSLSDEVKKCQHPARCPMHEKKIVEAAERCSTAAMELREEIRFLVENARKGSLASAIKVVAKTNWRKRRLDRLQRNLEDTEKLLQMNLLERTWYVISRLLYPPPHCIGFDAGPSSINHYTKRTFKHFLSKNAQKQQQLYPPSLLHKTPIHVLLAWNGLCASHLAKMSSFPCFRIPNNTGSCETTAQTPEANEMSPLYRAKVSASGIDIRSLKVDLRLFAQQLEKGYRDTDKLVSREHLKTREQISTVSKEANEAVSRISRTADGLALRADAQVDQLKRERFLQSLKYPGFNERRNQVVDAYGDSFRWVFLGDNDDQSNEDSSSDGDSGSPGSDKDSISDEDSTSNEDGTYDEDGTSDEEFVHSHRKDLSNVNWHSFSNWLRSTDTFYWISGKPGSGKTTLVKYILANPRTRSCLDVWSPRCLIVSHFLWRPGTSMQQNIKGFLCSLLYQLLESSATALDSVISVFSRPKDSDSDWSSPELQSACLEILNSYEHGVCLFLDGLDEVDPKDGPLQLLSLVDRLSQSKNTKICLASRPEPLLRTRLSTHPYLRLQDLTYDDLTLYARDHVEFPEEYIADEDVDPIRSLVNRAEGVFLWLVLAIRSINKGVEYGDSSAILQERVNCLPGDLTSIYKDMWDRACEDSPQQYRQTAALYFRLLLARKEPGLGHFGYEPFSLLHLVFASTSIADQVLDATDQSHELVPAETILQKCEEIERMLGVYCFGLIELGPEMEFPEDTAAAACWYGHKYDSIFPLANNSRPLQFIHRTARDFLLDTTSGKDILNYDTSSEFCLEYRFTKAYLACCALFIHTSFRPKVRINQWCDYLSVLRSMPWVVWNGGVSADWTRLILLYERLANSGKLFAGSGNYQRLCRGVDFLRAIAPWNFGDDIILSRITEETLDKDTKSDILLNACPASLVDYIGNWDHPRASRHFNTLAELLRAGADPNWQGCFFGPDSWSWPFMQLATPFMLYLEAAFLGIHVSSSVYHQSPAALPEILEVLLIFIAKGARLNERVTIFFEWEPWEGSHVEQGQPYVRHTLDIIYNHPPSQSLLVSFPAHTIIDTIVQSIRTKRAWTSEGGTIDRLCSSLESEYKNWHGRTSCEILGRVQMPDTHLEDDRYSWYEIREDQHEQIASKLRDYLKAILGLTPETWEHPHMEDVGTAKMFQSIWKQIPWVLKAKGKEDFFKRLEELVVYVRVEGTYEVHSTDEWVRVLSK